MKTSLILTSISSPNEVMKSFASGAAKNNIDFIVIGDTKSPKDFKLEGCRFYSIEEQESLPFRLSQLLPKKHYSRKNLGYIISKSHDVIIESDDDNFPFPDFWKSRKREFIAHPVNHKGWINVYNYFSQKLIWPRGFPLEQIHSNNPPLAAAVQINSPIQQGLADENPDVDAVYRMAHTLPVVFEKNNAVLPGEFAWCPFNSQNTTWFKEAFPLLYLPSFCSFRMTDIWRSFIAQRIAWTCGWKILFHQSTVWQERNEHILLKDFEDEIPGYLNNAAICKHLEELNLENGVNKIAENLLRCYRIMVEKKYVGTDELKLVEAWLYDLGI